MSISFGLAVIGFIILFYIRWFANKKFTRLSAIGAILFGQVFVVGIIWIFINSTNQEDDSTKLKHFISSNTLTVKLNNKLLDSASSNDLLKHLITIRDVQAHHSHPVDTNKVELSTSQFTVNLSLGKDSEKSNEYWIYWIKNSSYYLIGRVQINMNLLSSS